MVNIFVAQECFSAMDLPFIYGQAPDDHFDELRTRAKRYVISKFRLILDKGFLAFTNPDLSAGDTDFFHELYGPWMCIDF